MRAVPSILLLLSVAACSAPKEDAEPAAPAPPPAPTLATFAGSWDVSAVLDGVKDTVRTGLMGTADSTGWVMTANGRPNVPLTVSVVGDSLISQSAEYESLLRKGVKVTVRTASVLQNGMLVGTLESTYKTAKGPEVVKGSIMGMRAAEKK